MDSREDSDIFFSLNAWQGTARASLEELWDPRVDFASWLFDDPEAASYRLHLRDFDVRSWHEKLLVRVSVVVWIASQLQSVAPEDWMPLEVAREVGERTRANIEHLRESAQPWVTKQEQDALQEAYLAFQRAAPERRLAAETLFSGTPASPAIVNQLKRPLVVFYSGTPTTPRLIAQRPMAAHISADPASWDPHAREDLLRTALVGADSAEGLEWIPDEWLGMTEFLLTLSE